MEVVSGGNSGEMFFLGVSERVADIPILGMLASPLQNKTEDEAADLFTGRVPNRCECLLVDTLDLLTNVAL